MSDSTGPAIGIETVTSQVWRTSRDSPLPSDPTTSTSGSAARSKWSSDTEPSASNPAIISPAVAYSRRVRVRFVARATGSRAAVPADARQATAVMLAERRCGTTTPCPPNALTERTTAPRLRGSVTPSSAAISAGPAPSAAASSRSSGWAYSYAGTCRATP